AAMTGWIRTATGMTRTADRTGAVKWATPAVWDERSRTDSESELQASISLRGDGYENSGKLISNFVLFGSCSDFRLCAEGRRHGPQQHGIQSPDAWPAQYGFRKLGLHGSRPNGATRPRSTRPHSRQRPLATRS